MLDPIQFWVGLIGGALAIEEAVRRLLFWFHPRQRQARQVRITKREEDSLLLFSNVPDHYVRKVAVRIWNDSRLAVRDLVLRATWDGEIAVAPQGDVSPTDNLNGEVCDIHFATEGHRPVSHVPMDGESRPGKKGTPPPAYVELVFRDALRRRWWLDQEGRRKRLRRGVPF